MYIFFFFLFIYYSNNDKMATKPGDIFDSRPLGYKGDLSSQEFDRFGARKDIPQMSRPQKDKAYKALMIDKGLVKSSGSSAVPTKIEMPRKQALVPPRKPGSREERKRGRSDFEGKSANLMGKAKQASRGLSKYSSKITSGIKSGISSAFSGFKNLFRSGKGRLGASRKTKRLGQVKRKKRKRFYK